MTPPAAAPLAANKAIWPPFRRFAQGSFTLRDGRGGGHRVSSATADGPWRPGDLAKAEAAMADLGQTPLFMIRAGDGAMDMALEAHGFRVIYRTLLCFAEVASLAHCRQRPS